MHRRTEHEIRNALGNAASEVEVRLQHHVQRKAGHLPTDWRKQVDRSQLLGNGRDIPDLVSYAYRGVPFLTVWTRLVGEDLRIDLREVHRPIRVMDPTSS